MKIAIIGSGAMGSLMGSKLSNDNEVLFFDHWKSHVDTINKNGMTLKTKGNEEKYKNVKATSNYKDLKNHDVYIILVKGKNTLKEIKEVSKYINNDSIVVTLQNGLGNHYTINKYIDKSKIAYGMMDFSATLKSEANVYYELADSKVALTMFDEKENNKNLLFLNLVESLKNNKFNVHVDDALEEIWKKLNVNANFNAISAITGLTVGTLVKSNDYERIVKSITKEVVSVANKLNINLNYEDEIKNILKEEYKTSIHYPSMAQDVSRKNITEIDFINGGVINEAKNINVDTPVNKIIYDLVKLIENNYDHGKTFKI